MCISKAEQDRHPVWLMACIWRLTQCETKPHNALLVTAVSVRKGIWNRATGHETSRGCVYASVCVCVCGHVHLILTYTLSDRITSRGAPVDQAADRLAPNGLFCHYRCSTAYGYMHVLVHIACGPAARQSPLAKHGMLQPQLAKITNSMSSVWKFHMKSWRVELSSTVRFVTRCNYLHFHCQKIWIIPKLLIHTVLLCGPLQLGYQHADMVPKRWS